MTDVSDQTKDVDFWKNKYYEVVAFQNEQMKSGSYTLLTHLASILHQAQVDKGFWEDFENNWLTMIDRSLMLIVGEVAEAHEEYRSNNDPLHVYYRENGKPEGFSFELADVLIRTLDLAAALGIDIGAVVAEKHAFNKTRPHKHGRLF